MKTLVVTLQLCLAAIAVMLVAGCMKEPPKYGINIEQKMGAQVPFDAVFKDESGKDVKIGRYFTDKPVILVPVFYTCAGRCIDIMAGIVQVARDMKYKDVGRDFEIVTVSLNPKETSELAANKKADTMERYEPRDGSKGWHFLVGTEGQIHKVLDAVGYQYTYDPKSDRITHPTGIVVLTPSGKVSQYLFGVEYGAKPMLTYLKTASKDAVGEKVSEPLLLGCFSHDPGTNRITINVIRFMQVFGTSFAVLLFGSVAFMSKKYKTTALTKEPKTRE